MAAINLRELAESDLGVTLEGEFGLPVELIDPDGVKQTGIEGQVLYDTVATDPETLMPITVDNPVVTLRRSSLNRIPQNGEKWGVRIPSTPSRTAELDDYLFDHTRPSEGGASIGYIKLYLHRASQT